MTERGPRDTGFVGRQQDRQVWEGIFQQTPDAWRSAPPSDLMVECAELLLERVATRILDLGSGFGRWTKFVANETSGNPTASCTRPDYSDDEELNDLLGSWRVEEWA